MSHRERGSVMFAVAFPGRRGQIGDYVVGVAIDGVRWAIRIRPSFFPAATRIEDASVIHYSESHLI
jgi:hypothetical protein